MPTDERSLCRKLRRQRWIIAAAMGLLVALTGARFWLVSGLVRTHRVAGSSMAPSLLGEHYRVVCADCGIAFVCDAEVIPGDQRAVCPNCGYPRNELRPEQLHPGERVLVDRWPVLTSMPRRGDVLMIASVDDSHWPIVKRVAALPGEKLAIRRGDLFVGDEIVRKSLAELRQVAVLVHDNDYQPRKTAGLPARWQATAAKSQWRAAGGGFRVAPADGADAGELDTLAYHHWPCVGGPRERTKPSPVLDNDSYNQAASRQLNAVRDLLLSCRFAARGSGKLAFSIRSENARFEIILEPAAGIVSIVRDAGVIERQRITPQELRSARFTMALCDRQLLATLNGRQICRLPYEPHEQTPRDVLQPLAIGAVGLHVEVTQLHVWRDLYHLEPFGTQRVWQMSESLPGGQLALLGDNTTISIDSRHLANAGIPLAEVLGRIYRPRWMAEAGTPPRAFPTNQRAKTETPAKAFPPNSPQ